VAANWKKIKAEYIAGGTSYRKLAEKHGVSRTTLERKARDEKWTDLRRQKEGKTEAKIVDSISEKEAQKAVDIIDVADKLLGRIAEISDTLPVIDTQSLKHLTSALKDLKEIKGFKSEIDLREQEARIEKLRREADRDDNVSEVSVVFNAGEEEWNE